MSDLSPDLQMGTITWIFNCLGIQAEMLEIWCRGEAKATAQFLRTVGPIPSGPVDFVGSRVEIFIIDS